MFPQGVQITNLTHQSLDLSFTTTSSCLSILEINNRRFPNFQESSLTHYFRVDNLKSKSEYPYSISSGGQNYQLTEYKVKTATKPTIEASTSNLAWGKILKANQDPSSNTILYLTIGGALPLSAITDQSGQWHISLANSFTETKDSWFTPSANTPEELIIYSPDGTLTQISHTTSQNDPIPDIIIGQNYLSAPSPPVRAHCGIVHHLLLQVSNWKSIIPPNPKIFTLFDPIFLVSVRLTPKSKSNSNPLRFTKIRLPLQSTAHGIGRPPKSYSRHSHSYGQLPGRRWFHQNTKA